MWTDECPLLVFGVKWGESETECRPEWIQAPVTRNSQAIGPQPREFAVNQRLVAYVVGGPIFKYLLFSTTPQSSSSGAFASNLVKRDGRPIFPDASLRTGAIRTLFETRTNEHTVVHAVIWDPPQERVTWNENGSFWKKLGQLSTGYMFSTI
ncbi:hypothetical protein K438DRAFT_1782667 [Mycena galopus ATCC 62051]|nr:hypothetical protein K438DRAFT_1782667 [Mycena galopus ATCC 62051]